MCDTKFSYVRMCTWSLSLSLYLSTDHTFLVRVRQAEKKKKKISIKRPRAKKDEKKKVLLALKEYMQVDSVDGAESSGSGSEAGGGVPESPMPKPRSTTH